MDPQNDQVDVYYVTPLNMKERTRIKNPCGIDITMRRCVDKHSVESISI